MTSYPMLQVDMPSSLRPRARAFFRPILIIPHLLLVGGPAFGFLGIGALRTGGLGAVAWLCALYDWFALLFGKGPISGLQPYKRDYLTWRARVLAYGAFLRDEYPPFGEGSYPAALELPTEPDRRDSLLVFLRPILVLPHALWLLVLLCVWIFAGIFSWIGLTLTGSLPEPVWRFSRNVMEYSLRVEAYALLFYDEFPSFSLGREPDRASAI